MTITDHTMQLAEAVERAKQGEDYMVRCPAHEDGTASLHVSPSETGALLMCHAGCATETIIKSVNLSWADLFNEPQTRVAEQVWTPAGNASHVYPYHDATGSLLFEVLRVPQGRDKTFRQRRPSGDPSRPYVWNLEGVERVLYRLPQTIAAVRNGERIWVPEGEKDVDTLVAAGLHATCNSAGAGKWLPQYTETLAGAEVVIIQDADTVGRAHGRMVRDLLVEAGCRVMICEAPAPYKDVSALLGGGGSTDDLLTVLPFDDEERTKFGIDVLDIIVRDPASIEWVMPGTMSRRERLLIVGLEGQGKSMLLRQMAVQAAGGMHWWSLKDVAPQRVLVIDAENEPGQTLTSWQDLVGLAAHWGHPVERGQLTILEEWDSELDLASASGTAWLHERVHAYKPDLLMLGPLTNLVGRDLKDDEPVRRLKSCINSARAINGCAVVMEHHAPHKQNTDKVRSVRPYGSSMFLRWPDYGYGMQPSLTTEGVYIWQRTRWPRVRTRNWPEALRHATPNSADFPWTECLAEGHV